MTSTNELGLSSDRICGQSNVDLEFVQCLICQNILWQPVACGHCETPFCSKCIDIWLGNHPSNCPNRCTFTKRSCPRVIINLLARLNITCVYQQNGCDQTLPYEAVEKHEIQCDYRHQECPDCRNHILQKNFLNHPDECPSTQLTCPDCKKVYRRCDTSVCHSEIICLKEQLQQLRSETQQSMQQIRYEWKQDMQLIIQQFQNKRAEILPATASRHLKRVLDLPTNARWAQEGVTIAGGHGFGSANNQLLYPCGLDVDNDDMIIIADYGNCCIMQWKKGDMNGHVVAGGNEQGNSINQLNSAFDVLVDEKTNSLIISDKGNRRVVRWSRRNGTTKGEVLIENIDCFGLAMDDQRHLYVSDVEKHEIRKYDIDKGDTKGTVVAGSSGRGSNANQLNFPSFLFVDGEETVYVSDCYNHRVMKWIKDAQEGIVVAGGQGKGNSPTQLSLPYGLFVDSLGYIYVAESGNNRVTRWFPAQKQGSLIVGGNGDGYRENQLSGPIGLSFDRYGNLYVVDYNNHRVQQFSLVK